MGLKVSNINLWCKGMDAPNLSHPKAREVQHTSLPHNLNIGPEFIHDSTISNPWCGVTKMISFCFINWWGLSWKSINDLDCQICSNLLSNSDRCTSLSLRKLVGTPRWAHDSGLNFTEYILDNYLSSFGTAVWKCWKWIHGIVHWSYCHSHVTEHRWDDCGIASTRLPIEIVSADFRRRIEHACQILSCTTYCCNWLHLGK